MVLIGIGITGIVCFRDFGLAKNKPAATTAKIITENKPI
jgi:hypothetical protein